MVKVVRKKKNTPVDISLKAFYIIPASLDDTYPSDFVAA